jgi:aminoglycoside phosphotransferase (APT) family kinase protein
VLASSDAPGRCWLLIEDIPRPLPFERWPADPDLLGTLRRLHEASRGLPAPFRGTFRPAWPEEFSRQVLGLLSVEQARQIEAPLGRLREEAIPLFVPECAISGDPNPGNWRMREDGSLVLLDWERFGAGTPALDLAITVPGLGSPAEYAVCAAVYLGASGEGMERLARRIAVAKVWSVIEFLAHMSGRTDVPHREALIRDVPEWILAT